MVIRARKIPWARKKKEKAPDGYVWMYEWVKHFFNLKYECACAAQDTNISNMQEIVEIYKYKIEEICDINRNMR